MAVTVATLVLIKRTNLYLSVLAWIICGLQILELPFHPIFPLWYLLISGVWLFASYYFLTVISFQNLFQACPILLILLIGLPLRLYLLIDVVKVPYGWLSLFIFLSFAIAIMISIDIVSSSKLVFKQLFEMHRQKECFRTIMSSFPEGVMIAKVTPLDELDPNAKLIQFNGEESTMRKMNEDIDSDDDDPVPIRVDVLFMN